MAIDFADPGNATAKAVAAMLGISVGEATSRLRAQARAARLVERLSSQFPETFAGLRLDQRPAFRIRALFKGGANPADDVRNAANEAGIGQSVELGAAQMSNSDERTVAGKIAATLRASGRNLTFSIDKETGRVTIASSDSSLRQEILDLAPDLVKDVQLDPGIQIVPTVTSIAGEGYNSSVTTDPNQPPGCTTGFSVSANCYYCATTAGHCADGNAEFNEYPLSNTQYGSAGGYPLRFAADSKTNGADVQWMTLGSTSDQTGPFYWNGTNSIGIASTYKTAPQLSYSVCKFGRTTGWGCGAVAGSAYDAYGGPFYIADNGGTLSMEGDSGGPVVNRSVAYGWVHGRTSATPYRLVFTTIQQVYAYTPIRLTLCIVGTNC